MNEVFNLERQTALENRIDPTGKKWVIKGNRETALVHARPEPDRVDAQIPKVFQGQWTSPTVLVEKIDSWLNNQWDISERQANKARLKAHAVLNEVEEARKQTPEESLDALSDEIKQELGLDNANQALTSEVPEEGLPSTGEGSRTEADSDEEPTGRQEAKAKEVALEDRTWPEIQALASKLGIKPGKKAELIERIKAAEG